MICSSLTTAWALQPCTYPPCLVFMMRLSCHRFVANRVRLSLFILAYNLGNFLRRLCLPNAVKHWSLRSV